MRRLAIAALGAALLTAAAGCGKGARQQEAALSYQPVTRGDMTQSVQATGNVQPQNRVEVKPPIAGRVEEVLVREGDWVKRGQTVVLMSGTDRAALLDAARAKGPDELKRWEDLYKPTPLLAPVTGLVILRNVEPGRNVNVNDALLALSDHLIVQAQVDETDIAQVHVGQDADLSLDAYPGELIPAKVVHVAFEASTVNNVTVYDVEVMPLKTPAFMRSGMTANVDFIIERHRDVLIVPRAAVQRIQVSEAQKEAWKAKRDKAGSAAGSAEGGRGEGHGWSPFYVSLSPNAKGVSLTRSVKVGMSDGDRIEIREGLQEGEVVGVSEQKLPDAGQGGTNPFMPQRARVPRGGSRGGGSGGGSRR